MKIDKNKAGLVLGGFLGLWHLLWALLVAAGWAKPLIDFVLGLHFIGMPYGIMPFSATTMVELVIMTFVSGYVIGWVLAYIWNKVHRSA